MPYLVDTNILLRLQEPAHPMHADAAHAIEVLLERGERVCIVPQNLYEFWCVFREVVTLSRMALLVVDLTREEILVWIE